MQLPGAARPVVAKQRRGDPTPAEMQLLAQAVNSKDRYVQLEHGRGQEQPRILTLAFEMQERGWLAPPGDPEVVDRDNRRVRVWRFRTTDKGREVYRAQMARFGVKL